MPRFGPNPSMYAAGISGEGAVVSVNRRPLYGHVKPGPSASGHDWIAADLVAAIVWPVDGQALVAAIGLDGTLHELHRARAINYLTAGGGRWAATTWPTPHTPVVLVDGVEKPGVAPVEFAADGTLTWFPWGGQGLYQTAPDGRTLQLSSGVCRDVQTWGFGQAKWFEGGTLHAIGLPNWQGAAFLRPGPAWIRLVRPRDVWWVTYQTSSGENDSPVVAHPAHDARRGWIVKPRGSQSYRLDAAVDGDVVRFAWSETAGDAPQDLRDRAFAVDTPLKLFAPATPEPEPEKPKPEPPMPPEIPQLRDRLELVQEIRRALGHRDDQRLGNPHEDGFAITMRVAWALRDEGFGLVRAKPGSENRAKYQDVEYTTDVIALADGEHVDTLEAMPEFGGASWQPVRYRPDWQQAWNDAIRDRWVPAVEPTGSVPAPPPQPPAPPPTPPPAPTPHIPPRLPRATEVDMDHEIVDAIGPGGYYATAAGDRLAFIETTPSERTAIEVTKPDDKFTLRFVEANRIINFPPRWGSGERSGAVDLDRQFETRGPDQRGGHESPTIVELPCGRIIAYVEHDEGGRRFTSVPLSLVRR